MLTIVGQDCVTSQQCFFIVQTGDALSVTSL